MKPQTISLLGMPYFPGVALGMLHRGINKGAADYIALISPDEIKTVSELPAGFIVIEGAPFSHALIGLLAHAVPTVLISQKQADELKEGMRVLLNGETGEITDKFEFDSVAHQKPPSFTAGAEIFTVDNVAVNLCASVRNTTGAQRAASVGAKAIGLVRTEYVLPEDDRIPDLAYYRNSFRELCLAANPLSLTFRLLDLSTDKMTTWVPEDVLGGVLGLQGARLYGIDPVRAIVEAQLSAISELTNEFDLRVLIPYLVRYEELNYWVEHIRQQLPSSVPIGAMAETPAGALDIKNWLTIADFVSIGCNDLMQCLFAADRDQSELRYYLDPYAPFLFRFFHQMAQAADAQLDKVQLCGLLPQMPGVIPVLLGLGYRTFSVDAAFIPYLAQTLKSTSITDAQSLAAQVCAAKESHEVLEILKLPREGHRPFLM
jgi:phosphoenolpyruvate-protein kinase (PTS system EI component)